MKISWGKEADEPAADAVDDKMQSLQARLEAVEALPAQLEEARRHLQDLQQQVADLQVRVTQADACQGALDALSLALRTQPTITLYASGLADFCHMFEEEFYRQHPQMLERFQAQRTASHTWQQFSAFVAWASQRLAEVHEGLSQSPLTEATRNLWETYVVPIHGKFEECTARLQALQQEQSGAEGTEAVPTFDQYLQALLSDASRAQQVLDQQTAAFSWVLDEYAREAARCTLRNLQASQESAAGAAGEAARLRTAMRAWMVSDLLRLSDYLDEMGEKALSGVGSVNQHLSACVQTLLAEFKNLLSRLHVEPIVIELNRDQMGPALHEIVQRNGPGQTIVKIVAPGFAWEGEPLRKAEVWVA